jgi:hypothetical protein
MTTLIIIPWLATPALAVSTTYPIPIILSGENIMNKRTVKETLYLLIQPHYESPFAGSRQRR